MPGPFSQEVLDLRKVSSGFSGEFFIPDEFIDQAWPHGSTGGRHREYTAAQLYRVHLLSLLSPVHSLNLLVKMLPEQRAWRKSARLTERIPA